MHISMVISTEDEKWKLIGFWDDEKKHYFACWLEQPVDELAWDCERWIFGDFMNYLEFINNDDIDCTEEIERFKSFNCDLVEYFQRHGREVECVLEILKKGKEIGWSRL